MLQRKLAKNPSPELAQLVIECYADLQALSLLGVGAHWNVTGPNFYELHRLYQRIYEELNEAIDRIAEHIRYLGSKVPFSFESLQFSAGIEFPLESDDPMTLHIALSEGHGVLEASLREAINQAQIEKAEGTVNLLSDELEKCGARLYLLRSQQA